MTIQSATSVRPKNLLFANIWYMYMVMILSEMTEKECVKERYPHSTAKNLIAQHCADVSNSWVVVYVESIQVYSDFAVRLTRIACHVVWSEKESHSAVTDSCGRWQRETEMIAAAVVPPTRTYSDSTTTSSIICTTQQIHMYNVVRLVCCAQLRI